MSKNEIQNESINLKEDKISELNKTINEKKFELNSLQSKILEFGENIDLLKKQNEKLQKEVKYIGNELNFNNSNDKQIFSKNILQIQPTQRFIVLSESNYNNSESFINLTNNYSSINNYNKELSLIEESLNNNFEIIPNYITNNLNSKLTPFKLQPYKQFDHRKLNINYKEFENNLLDEALLNEIKKNNRTIIDSMFNFSIDQNDYNKSNSSQEKKTKVKKYHSSMFFKKCKKVMNKNEYKNLLDIIKLSNAKKITKEETYLKITNLLVNNYPELSNEFKLLFI